MISLQVLQQALSYIQEQHKLLQELNAIRHQAEVKYVKICGKIIDEITKHCSKVSSDSGESDDDGEQFSEGEIMPDESNSVEVKPELFSNDCEDGSEFNTKINNSRPKNYRLMLVDAPNLNTDPNEENPSYEKNEGMPEETEMVYTISTSAIIHELEDVNYKRFQCGICFKLFAQKDNARKHHKTIHLGIKNYECSICHKKFRDKRDIVLHENTHTNEFTISSCKICKKKFKGEDERLNHEKLHTGDGSLECEICRKIFANKKNLIKHKKCHEKRFACDFCDKKFVSRGPLKQHLFVHSTDQPFKCNYCDVRFKGKYDKKKHENVQHYLEQKNALNTS